MAGFLKKLLFTTIILLVAGLFIANKSAYRKLGEPLKGVWTPLVKQSFTDTGWLRGSYQKNKSAYYNENLAYRPLLIRILNESDFRVYHYLNSPHFFTGRNDFLWERAYTNSLKGLDYSGEKALRKMLSQIRQVQMNLAREHVAFLLVLAPSKARFWPENIPEREKPRPGVKTNYEELSRLLDTEFTDIRCFDANRWFLDLKGKWEYPLYTAGSTHWSVISARTLVADSLLGCIRSATGKKIPRLRTDSVVYRYPCEIPDNDLEGLANLLFPHYTKPQPYPLRSVTDSAGTYRPSVLGIGDSYYWQIFGNPDLRNVLGRHDFWYYNKVFYPPDIYGKRTQWDTGFLYHELLKHDIVLLLATETNMEDLFGFGRFEGAMTDPAKKQAMEASWERDTIMEYYRRGMLINQEWLDRLKQQASAENKTLDKVMDENALFMYQQEMKKREKH